MSDNSPSEAMNVASLTPLVVNEVERLTDYELKSSLLNGRFHAFYHTNEGFVVFKARRVGFIRTGVVMVRIGSYGAVYVLEDENVRRGILPSVCNVLNDYIPLERERREIARFLVDVLSLGPDDIHVNCPKFMKMIGGGHLDLVDILANRRSKTLFCSALSSCLYRNSSLPVDVIVVTCSIPHSVFSGIEIKVFLVFGENLVIGENAFSNSTFEVLLTHSSALLNSGALEDTTVTTLFGHYDKLFPCALTPDEVLEACQCHFRGEREVLHVSTGGGCLKKPVVAASMKVEMKSTSCDFRGRCVICLDKKSNYAVDPCGHICLCSVCIDGNMIGCPLCRTPITKLLEVFQST